MDFIERTLGFSPDGGNGLFELLIFVGLIALGVAIVRRPRGRRQV